MGGAGHVGEEGLNASAILLARSATSGASSDDGSASFELARGEHGRASSQPGGVVSMPPRPAHREAQERRERAARAAAGGSQRRGSMGEAEVKQANFR